jgi:RNA polymerase sigma factor (sigma-70 family)
VRRVPPVEDLLRASAPRVLGVLIRRHGQFDLCEDAVQEALLAAARQWPEQGVPENPVGWLITVADRRFTDQVRTDTARRRREDALASRVPSPGSEAAPEGPDATDDTVVLLLMCCHPELSPPSQLALTLRAVGGLTTAEIARAFLVPEATMAQRISRAKQKIRETGARFSLPPTHERADRLRVVLHVLYLMFNEGYTTTSGPTLHRTDLTSEAIRLTRVVSGLLPDEGEVAGLLALMLLTDARRDARTSRDGSLIPLREQDRSRWNRPLIREGVALITDALSRSPLGPYQVQAAIAAIHDEAASVADTDWHEILGLYALLEQFDRSPVVTLNRAVAVAMVFGPEAGLQLLDDLAADERMANHHRLHSTRAHLLEMAGATGTARVEFDRAARATTSLAEKRYLEAQSARLGGTGAAPEGPATERRDPFPWGS